MGRILYATFISALIAGMFMGIYLKTGEKVNPTDLTLEVSSQVVNELENEQMKKSWVFYEFLIFLISLIFTIINMITIIMAGLPSIFISITGYLGMIFIILNIFSTFAVFLMVSSFIMSYLIPDY